MAPSRFVDTAKSPAQPPSPNVDSAFYSAAHCRPLVLGLRLKELKVGHARLLFENNSPYFDHESPTPDFHDFLIAVFICSQEPDESRRNLDAWWFRLFVFFWSLKIRKSNLILEREVFEQYLSTHRSKAQLDPFKHRNLSEVKTPPFYRLLVILMQHLNQPLETIDAMPMRLANGLYFTWGDLEGAIHIISDRQKAFLEFAREQDRLKFGAKEENN
jgi:hypothetical protein